MHFSFFDLKLWQLGVVEPRQRFKVVYLYLAIGYELKQKKVFIAKVGLKNKWKT